MLTSVNMMFETYLISTVFNLDMNIYGKVMPVECLRIPDNITLAKYLC